MQPRNLSLGVAKQLGPDGPGEGRQARAGALCALACVIFARHLRKEVLKRMGRAGRERKEGKQQGWSACRSSRGQSDHTQSCHRSWFCSQELPPSQCRELWGNFRKKRMSTMMTVCLAPVLSFRVASFSMLQAQGQSSTETDDASDDGDLDVFAVFRVASFCDSTESLPLDGILINLV